MRQIITEKSAGKGGSKKSRWWPRPCSWSPALFCACMKYQRKHKKGRGLCAMTTASLIFLFYPSPPSACRYCWEIIHLRVDISLSSTTRFLIAPSGLVLKWQSVPGVISQSEVLHRFFLLFGEGGVENKRRAMLDQIKSLYIPANVGLMPTKTQLESNKQNMTCHSGSLCF